YLYRRIEYKIEDAGLKQIMLEDSVSSLLKPGNLFDIDILQQERERITYLFKTKGYYSFIKEFIDYQIDTAITEHKADVIIRINNPVATNSFLSGNHKKFLLNDIYVFTNFDPKRSLQEKEAYYQVFDTLEYQGYYFVYEDKLAIKPQIILRAISLKKSDLYDIREVENTYNYLTSLKLYKLTNIVMSEVNDSVDSNDNSLLDCIIQLTPFTRQAYSVELEGTNTSGNLGIAANTKYQHKSLFRGGELFELNFKGALQAQTRIIESSDESGVTEYLPFNTLEVGPESSLKIPKLLIPFRMEEFTKKYHPKTSVLSAYNFQRRPEYTRSILTGKIGYFWSGAKNITHIINPLELNYIKLMNIDAQFQEMINKSNFGNSYKNQLITSANYNLAFTNQDIKKIRDFSYLKVGIETAGNMFSLYNKIGEKVKLENYYMILDVKYAQYFKFDFDYSFHKIINPENKIVYHGCAGLGLPYGNSDAMPFVKQYFAGGANSIRAWNVRTLGPGAFKNDDPNNQYPNHYKEIAAGAGLGVRLNLEFFIFRLDVGYKIADPSESEGKRIVIGRRPFGQNEIAWALGIGYPF
ncbi:MAG: BamA/TamA family outer membrane protein, partial [Bacteroidia bacterium]|nr:BamA/TamA family outer membrane protein [Bacteroidia bacterium]